MQKILVVGDIHATQSELEECEGLIDFIIKTYKSNDCDLVVFLGDQYHNHGLVNLHVLQFWKDSTYKMREREVSYVMLKGNHDMPFNGRMSAVEWHRYAAFGEYAKKDYEAKGWWTMCDYYPTEEDFLKALGRHHCGVLFCHQTFKGCEYDNGYYDTDGFDFSKLNFRLVVSGHIHKPQAMHEGQLWYPGSPRWRTLSDANQDRGIWILDIHSLEKTFISTAKVCNPIHKIVVDGYLLNPATIPTGTVCYDLKGDVKIVEANAALLAHNPSIRVRKFPTAKKEVKVRESVGLDKSLSKYLTECQFKENVDRSTVTQICLNELKNLL